MTVWLPGVELRWWHMCLTMYVWPLLTDQHYRVSTITLQFAWDHVSLVTIPTVAFSPAVTQACFKSVPMYFSDHKCSGHRHWLYMKRWRLLVCYRLFLPFPFKKSMEVGATFLLSLLELSALMVCAPILGYMGTPVTAGLFDRSTDFGSVLFDPLPFFLLKLKAQEK